MLRLCNLVFDTVLEGIALHHLYGFSLHMVKILQELVVNIFLHLDYITRRKARQRNHPPQDEPELAEQQKGSQLNQGENQ